MGQPRVLVVDDDSGICHLLESFLSARGYQAITVATAEDALERYHVDRPAAVILDVALPGRMDGLDALAAFRKIDRDVPVIPVESVQLDGVERGLVVVNSFARIACQPRGDAGLERLSTCFGAHGPGFCIRLGQRECAGRAGACAAWRGLTA